MRNYYFIKFNFIILISISCFFCYTDESDIAGSTAYAFKPYRPVGLLQQVPELVFSKMKVVIRRSTTTYYETSEIEIYESYMHTFMKLPFTLMMGIVLEISFGFAF